MRIRPGEECATAYQNLVQGMLSTDTGFFKTWGAGTLEHVSDQVQGVH
jgi:hypothetical protein